MYDRSLSVVGLRQEQCPVTLTQTARVRFLPAPNAQNVPLLLCQEQFN
jgi:hypothetical protein